jgi:calcineurin-like phosphoesterase family protein
MINVWFTSDFHLGHRNIIRYCNRPFDSTDDMDATILANLNKKVGENDILYFLGDFCLGGTNRAKHYPRGSPENRPTMISAKPANGVDPEQQ